MKLTKQKQDKLMKLAKDVLYHRRNCKLDMEQRAFEKLDAYCQSIGLWDCGIGAGQVIEQAVESLRQTSVAAGMNGIIYG